MVRSQVLMTEPLPSLNKVNAQVIQHERTLNIGHSGSSYETNLFYVNANQQNKNNNWQNRRITGGLNNSSKRPTCTHCGLIGHTVDKCYKKHGCPPGYKP